MSDQPNTPPDNSPAPGGTPAAFDPIELKNALKAFKKRLKMAKLDDESRLGHGPMSSGGNSGIVAIVAPNQWPRAVWDELARQGKLRRSGHGLYELGDVP